MSVNSNKLERVVPTAGVARALGRFRAYLVENRMRFTAQRRLVFEQVYRQDSHFHADELYEVLRAGGSDVSRATVYRTLGHLRDCGLVQEMLQCRGRAYYEAIIDQEHHDHMLCVRCGRVMEFRDEQIEELQRRVCRRRGFKALDHRMSIRGVCKQCREAERKDGT